MVVAGGGLYLILGAILAPDESQVIDSAQVT